MKKYIFLIGVIGVVTIGVSVFSMRGELDRGLIAQTVSPTKTPPVVDDSIDRPTSDPYTGDLARFDREKRAEKLQIARVMDILKMQEGSFVADIGAGGGWFSVIAARRVGVTGKVFAIDINKESKDFIDGRAEKENLRNIETIISNPDDPLLSKNSVDSVLILNTYHEFSAPVTVMRNLRRSLKNGAMVGIIDRNGDGDDHGIDSEKVIEEATRAGYIFKETYDFVRAAEMDYLVVFTIDRTDDKQ